MVLVGQEGRDLGDVMSGLRGRGEPGQREDSWGARGGVMGMKCLLEG